MNKLEEIGRDHVINQINALESSRPGLSPMFYFTGSFESDIEAATRLRDEHDMPRPENVTQMISEVKTKYVERVAVFKANRDHHLYRMKTDLLYRWGVKLGWVKCPY